MTKSEQEIALMRQLADHQSGDGSDQDILTWAQIAGTTLVKADIDRFLSIVHDFTQNPFRQEAMMVYIRLALESGDFAKARQAAAVLCNLEHYVFHARVRVRIAKFSEDAEDRAIAEEFLRELLETTIPAEAGA